MFITQTDKSKEISGLITRAVTVIHGNIFIEIIWKSHVFVICLTKIQYRQMFIHVLNLTC